MKQNFYADIITEGRFKFEEKTKFDITKYPQFFQTKEEIEEWLNKMEITNYIINEDLTVDVNGNVTLEGEKFEYFPVKFRKVSGKFNSSYCEKITSLEGCPSKVGDDFLCSRNQLVDVKGFPLNIRGYISIEGPVKEIFKLFPVYRWKEVPEYLNEYNVIRDGRKVILQALEVVYDELSLEVPENIEIKGYEII